jgi:hypothetical protein
MKSPRIAFLAYLAISALAACILPADRPALQANELEKLRGGNTNQMQCTATCNHLNGYDTPCNNQQQGGTCTICSGTNYNYSTQVSNPVPAGCTTNNNGFQTDPNNNQQGCGFQIRNATCQTQGTGLVCQGGTNSVVGCKGSVVVDPQSAQPPPPG